MQLRGIGPGLIELFVDCTEGCLPDTGGGWASRAWGRGRWCSCFLASELVLEVVLVRAGLELSKCAATPRAGHGRWQPMIDPRKRGSPGTAGCTLLQTTGSGAHSMRATASACCSACGRRLAALLLLAQRHAVRAAGCMLAQLQCIWGEGLPVGGTRAVLRARLEAAAPPCAQPPAQ
jgi:hypothetical protein